MASRFLTLPVPVLAPGVQPVILVRAAQAPVRCMVRNVGGGEVVLSFGAQALSGPMVTIDTYRLPPGTRDVFLLATADSLYAAGSAASTVSVHVSAADLVPVDPT